MFGIIKAKYDNKKLFLLSPYDLHILFGKKICNSELLLLESKYIYKQGLIVSNFSKILVTILLIPSRVIDRILGFFGKSLSYRVVVPAVGERELWATKNELKNGFSWETVEKYNWKERINSYYDLSIRDSAQRVAKIKMSTLGISSSSWFVCLHVRESGFRKDKGRREYRNSHILNYIPAIKRITKAGGIVVRMGDSTMTKLPKMNNVVDYPFTEQKSSLMDIFLIKNCKFYIGTLSGILDTAFLFRKDILIINMYNWLFGYPFSSRDRGIYKHVYSKSQEKYLTFDEVLSSDWKMQALFGDIDNDYELIENTPNDIEEAVLEYMDCSDRDDFSINTQQVKLNNKRVNVAKEIYKKYSFTNMDDYEEIAIKYRLATRINKDMHGTISNCYLKKYLDTPYGSVFNAGQ